MVREKESVYKYVCEREQEITFADPLDLCINMEKTHDIIGLTLELTLFLARLHPRSLHVEYSLPYHAFFMKTSPAVPMGV